MPESMGRMGKGGGGKTREKRGGWVGGWVGGLTLRLPCIMEATPLPMSFLKSTERERNLVSGWVGGWVSLLFGWKED